MRRMEQSLLKMEAFLGFFLLLFVSIVSSSNSKILNFKDSDIGINYGRLGSNLPSPENVPRMIASLSSSIKHVKTFDMDPVITKAFAKTGISLSLCVPNEKIHLLAYNQSEADTMIETLILPFHTETMISSISVGNEVSMLPEFSQILFPAIVNIYRSLRKHNLHYEIKVSTTHSLAILALSLPPSSAVFQASVKESVLMSILSFLKWTNSPFMVNIYPYLTYKEPPGTIPLEFALFAPSGNNRIRAMSFEYVDTNNGLKYTNLFDILVDAMISAVSSLGFHDLPLVITETGWPSGGSVDDSAASLWNAAVFNQGLVEHLSNKPLKGTPLRPGIRIPTYIFALFDEDQKDGALSERHWGVLYPNGTRKYNLHRRRENGSLVYGWNTQLLRRDK